MTCSIGLNPQTQMPKKLVVLPVNDCSLDAVCRVQIVLSCNKAGRGICDHRMLHANPKAKKDLPQFQGSRGVQGIAYPICHMLHIVFAGWWRWASRKLRGQAKPSCVLSSDPIVSVNCCTCLPNTVSECFTILQVFAILLQQRCAVAASHRASF